MNCPVFKDTTGLRKYRIGNVAAFDFIGTIIIAFIVTYFTGIPVSITLVLLLLLGFLFHYLFSVKTASSIYFT